MPCTHLRACMCTGISVSKHCQSLSGWPWLAPWQPWNGQLTLQAAQFTGQMLRRCWCPPEHETWHPRGLGPQPLYTFRVRLTAEAGQAEADSCEAQGQTACGSSPGQELLRRIGLRQARITAVCAASLQCMEAAPGPARQWGRISGALLWLASQQHVGRQLPAEHAQRAGHGCLVSDAGMCTVHEQQLHATCMAAWPLTAMVSSCRGQDISCRWRWWRSRWMVGRGRPSSSGSTVSRCLPKVRTLPWQPTQCSIIMMAHVPCKPGLPGQATWP